ncbi:hypothetical protein M408DRAFT_208006 [Serendipita vermifera MAFF 305830]|uniref:Uncharacterized protein n=1 Tax=Serendipita vermifera MAFF 305830 TaxID=933852 RepID=A0A0C3AZZ1_SERVB|nr:hypothetical protein M408DRAFT_208006 [Serendipita vermifera MAFF 305830]
MNSRKWMIFSSKLSEREENEAGTSTKPQSNEAESSPDRRHSRGKPLYFPKKEDYMFHGGTSLCVIPFLVKVEIVKEVLRNYLLSFFHPAIQSHAYSPAPGGVVVLTTQSVLDLCHWSNTQFDYWRRLSDVVSILGASDSRLRDVFFVLYHRLYKKDPPPSYQVFHDQEGSGPPLIIQHDAAETARRLRVARSFTGQGLVGVIGQITRVLEDRMLDLRPFGTHDDLSRKLCSPVATSSVNKVQTDRDDSPDPIRSLRGSSTDRSQTMDENSPGSAGLSDRWRSRELNTGDRIDLDTFAAFFSERADAAPVTNDSRRSALSFRHAGINSKTTTQASTVHEKDARTSSSPMDTGDRFSDHSSFYDNVSSESSFDKDEGRSKKQRLRVPTHRSSNSKPLKRPRDSSLEDSLESRHKKRLKTDDGGTASTSKQPSYSREGAKQHAKPLAKRRRASDKDRKSINDRQNPDNEQKEGDEKGSSSGSGELSYAESRGSPASYTGSGSDSNSGSFHAAQAEYMARPSTRSSLDQIFASVERSINSRQNHSRSASLSSR